MRFSGFTIGLVALLLLAACSESKSEPPPTEPIAAAADSASQARLLTIRYWQAPSLANPYLSSGIKDRDAGAITLEPLAGYDPDGKIVPKLAAEIPTLENRGISPDLTSITWRLKEGLKWSDGSDVTADDVAFTWVYCVNEETGCVAVGAFTDVESVEPLDDLTVRITFDAPTPYPYDAFVGASTPVISQAQFADCIGAVAASCDDENTMPIGTGPYRITSFEEGVGAEYERNSHYRGERPYFDRVILEGGGEAVSAARAALETGEVDYAWNLQVEPEILKEMEGTGLGKLVIAFGNDVERIVVNQTNPDAVLSDDRSEYLEGGNPHPFLTFMPISQAMSMAIDRRIIADQLYGFAAEPTCNLIADPQHYVSFTNDACLSQDIEAANRLLDESGVLDGDSDGIREYNGIPLQVVYQTTANSIRQDTQALIRDWWEQIGIATELVQHDPAAFFGGDPAVNEEESYRRFFADVQMYTTGPHIEPQQYLAGKTCDSIPTKDDNWAGANISRACNREYDELFTQLAHTRLGPEREELVKQLNDIRVQNYYEIPLVVRGLISAHSNTLKRVRMSSWDSELWNIAEWHR